MAEGNGHEEAKVKWCPFLNEYCIGERCAIQTEVIKSFNGLQHKAILCGFNALGMILSEINAKTVPPQAQKISLPSGLRPLKG